MSHTVRIEHFEGPLDLLLQLVEQEKLDISTVSLAAVAEQFVARVREEEGKIPPEDLADFLFVAAKLMYLKSKLLLPELVDPELEEGPDLEAQLREYRRFIEAAREIDKMWKAGNRSFLGAVRTLQTEGQRFLPPPASVTPPTLAGIMARVIARLEPLLRLPQARLERAMTLEEKIHDLVHHVTRELKTSFHRFIAGARDKTEAILSFLALLELVKQRTVRVEQEDLFQDIAIEHPEAAASSSSV